MPSKTQFLFIFAALVAILLPSLLYDHPLEVIATLDQTRYTVISALGIAPSPIIDTVDTLFALYARLCGTLSSGPLDESAVRTNAVWYDFYVTKHGQDQMRYLDPPRFAMYTSFARGVEGGLQLPGAESRTPISRAAVFLALAGTLALSFLPSPLTIATYGYRAVVNSNFLTTFGSAFLANVVPVMTKVARAIKVILQSFAECIPAAFQVISVFVAGLTSCALVFVTVVACWGVQMFDAARMRWTGLRFASDDYSKPIGTQTDDFMPGICRELASVCEDRLRRFMVVEDVLDTERHQHADELAKAGKVRREQDAELGRLRKESAARGKELSTAKEEKENLDRDLRQARATISKHQTTLQSTRDNAKADISSRQGKMDAERSQWDEEKQRLEAQLASADKQVADLEQQLKTEQQTRAEATWKNCEAAVAAEQLTKELTDRDEQIEALEQQVSKEQQSREDQHSKMEKMAQARDSRIERLEALAAKQKKIADFPMSDLLLEVLTYCDWEDNPFAGNPEEYRLATELRGTLTRVLPKEDPPCINGLKSTEEASPPTVAGPSETTRIPQGRPIRAFTRPSAKLARAGRSVDGKPEGESAGKSQGGPAHEPEDGL